MPDSKRPVFIVSLLLLVTSTHADTLTGQVVAVADGDTITVLDANRHQERIRFQGIDAPERAQAFGQVSKKHLAGLVFGKHVEMQYAKHRRWINAIQLRQSYRMPLVT